MHKSIKHCYLSVSPEPAVERKKCRMKNTLLEILGGLARYSSGSVRFDNCHLE
jgi:hypothetical protein